MKNIRFNNKELEEVYTLYNDALTNLWDLWQLSPLKEINFIYKIEQDKNNTHWSFTINDNGISIASYLVQRLFHNPKTNIRTYNLGKPKHNKKSIKKNMSLSEDIVFSFLQDYENIKTKMIQYLERGTKNKEEFQNILSKIKTNLNKEATIEINMPETNNQHQVEIVESNGQKIGTITFGDISIKLITEGDITLVNKQDNQKIKKK